MQSETGDGYEEEQMKRGRMMGRFRWGGGVPQRKLDLFDIAWFCHDDTSGGCNGHQLLFGIMLKGTMSIKFIQMFAKHD